VKIAFLFFLLITHLCGAPASWAARHTTVCLDSMMIVVKMHVNFNDTLVKVYNNLSSLLIFIFSTVVCSGPYPST